jgi:polysaccharide deacetylase 2 family uncharacterized protein YibQ
VAGRVGRRRTSFNSIALLMLIPIAGFVVYLAVKFFREQIPSHGGQAPPPVQAKVIAAPPARTGEAPVVHKSRGDIVLILDDVGFDHQPLGTAMRIDPNVNFSILPNAARAQDFAEMLHSRGFEILCHLPMEPIDYPRQSPGANAVMTSMSDDEIARTTRDDIAAVPHAAGVNNHMGSRATRDARVMTSMLSAIPKGMYFIDSRTGPGSVGEKIARELKIPTASRQVFLDDVQRESAVRHQLQQLADAAAEHGVAIGIGHMYDVTVRVLNDEVPNLRSRGFRLLRASQSVN